MTPIGQAPSVKYHDVGLIDGALVTFCFYCLPGESELVPLGRARKKCPRCGGDLRPFHRPTRRRPA